MPDGTSDGSILGGSEDTMVGAKVGFSSLLLAGAEADPGDGRVTGDLVGGAVGFRLGMERVGGLVGERVVGEDVGDSVGELVGQDVGDDVGPSVGFAIPLLFPSPPLREGFCSDPVNGVGTRSTVGLLPIAAVGISVVSVVIDGDGVSGQ